MKANAIKSSETSSTEHQQHDAKFTKVLDGRKQPIRGLWVRNGRFYAQLRLEDDGTGEKKPRRVPLLDKDQKPVSTVAQAREAMETLKVKRSESALPMLVRTPKFFDYVDTYLDFIKAGQGRKKRKTIKKEEYTLNGWIKHLGGIRLDKIHRSHINAYVTERLQTKKRRWRSLSLSAGL